MSDRFIYLKINDKIEKFEYTYDRNDEVYDGTSKHTYNNIKREQFLTPREIAQHEHDRFPATERKRIAAVSKEDLIAYHHGYGTFIRNSYGLWHPSNPFVVKDDLGDGHPDGLSMIAIRHLHELCTKRTTAFDDSMTIIQEK